MKSKTFSPYMYMFFHNTHRSWIVMSAFKTSPMWVSISRIFSMLLGSMRLEVTLFSTANTTPSGVDIPTAVDPSWKKEIAFISRYNVHYTLKNRKPYLFTCSCIVLPRLSYKTTIKLNKPWLLQWHIPLERVALQEKKCSHPYINHST